MVKRNKIVLKTKLKIKKGDEVIVTTGKYKGTKGAVKEVLIARNRIIVAGVALVKKHVKAKSAEEKSGIFTKEASIHISNVSLVDKDGKPSKVGFKIDDKNVKKRFLKTTDEIVNN
jgi:large subunit ribosomal protein L24